MGLSKYEGLVNDGKNHFNGTVRTHPDTLDIPIRRKSPTVYFVNSMSDLFHKEVSEDFVVRTFDVMTRCPQHTFQVLTKRPHRMRAMMPGILRNLATDSNGASDPPPNVWIGTSVEDQAAADDRIPPLAETPASVRFLSCEPLLGPIDDLDLTAIDWVIVGGESGPGARPMKREWVERIRKQCVAKRVPFFFKQWGGVRKKSNGRTLHGRTWDEMPDVRHTLSRDEKQRFRAQLERIRERLSREDPDAANRTLISRQEKMAELGWLWKSDLSAIRDLFRRYDVA